MNVAVAFDAGIFRPEGRAGDSRILDTKSRVIAPREFLHGIPVMERAIIFRAAYDPEAGVYVVSRYPGTGDGITFEASSIEDAFDRAAAIVPDVLEASGAPHEAIGIIIDEYDSAAVFES